MDLCVCELFGEPIHNILGVVVILLLNVMEVLSVGGDALLDRPYMVFQTEECVWCACDPSVHIDVPSIGFIYVCVISSFRRAGSQVFFLLMLFLCVMLHTMWSGKSLQLLYILPFGILCLSAIRMMVVKLYGSMFVGGYCVQYSMTFVSSE